MLSSSVSFRETRGLPYQLQRAGAIREGAGIRAAPLSAVLVASLATSGGEEGWAGDAAWLGAFVSNDLTSEFCEATGKGACAAAGTGDFPAGTNFSSSARAD